MNNPPSSRPRIVVVGSINMDLVFRTQRLARPGETVAGHSFRQIPGGKGANQAVAAARLGAQVAMVGRVGNDEFGSTLLDGLKRESIDVTHVTRTSDVASGLAVIGVDDSGENSITVLSGANGQLSPADVVSAESVFQQADVLLLQLEIPISTVHKAIETGRRYGLKIILDPAPAGDGLILDNL
jgi:ribokinase